MRAGACPRCNGSLADESFRPLKARAIPAGRQAQAGVKKLIGAKLGGRAALMALPSLPVTPRVAR
jgi:hypothetical protein